MRTLILTALALAAVAWYARHRKRFVRAREYAHEERESWENEGGASSLLNSIRPAKLRSHLLKPINRNELDKVLTACPISTLA